ncbi:TetR/AcrR family transcriptional regulator [Actinomadura sp. WMMB 499]|uniref:TetR/AcrR family transcriptional regulator n=1 Tax=Actinomadura sp. WMMB 499 TaxID=1219491 RepID=UPI001C3F8944|nr:TetR/AcrR family transcriptional regulator [Actinomadura sp. WMMB 499]
MTGPPGTDGRVRAAAVTLFAAKGFHGTGIRELADAAGLSSAALYHYMGTKEDLLVEIMRTSLDRLIRAAGQITDRAPSPAAALNGLVQGHVAAHALRRAETLVVDTELRSLSAGRRGPLVALRDEYEGLWASVIGDGLASGAFQVPDAAVARLALLQMCSGVANWYSPDGRHRLADIAEMHARMGLAMLGAGPCPDPPTAEHCVRLVIDIWDDA